MYLEFYGFHKNPFHPSRDAEFYYPSRSHRAALADLESAISGRSGILLVTGEAGTGKSSLLEELARRCKKHAGTIAIPFNNPLVTFSKLVHTMHERLFPDKQPAASIEALLDQFKHELTSKRTRGWNVVLLIDEAQHIPTDTLAQLGRLLKINNSEGRVIQIVLAGQPELEERFESRRLDHLVEFISRRSRITALEEGETRTYIEHRVRVAAAANPDFVFPFSAEVVEQIARRADGRPANINRVCHQALVTGAQYHEKPIEMPTASLALPEVELPPPRSGRWLGKAIASALALSAILLLIFFVPRLRDSQASAASVPSDRSSADRLPSGSQGENAGARQSEDVATSPSPPAPTIPPSDPADLGRESDVDGPTAGAPLAGAQEPPLEARVDSWVTTLNQLDEEPRAVTWVGQGEPGAANEPHDAPSSERRVPQPVATERSAKAPGAETPAARIETHRAGPPSPEPAEATAADTRDAAGSASSVLTEDLSPAEIATLSIAAYPIAEVYIDTQLIGQTPLLAVEVPIGRRFIEAVVDGRRQTRVEVLRRGEHRSITFRFDAEDRP